MQKYHKNRARRLVVLLKKQTDGRTVIQAVTQTKYGIFEPKFRFHFARSREISEKSKF